MVGPWASHNISMLYIYRDYILGTPTGKSNVGFIENPTCGTWDTVGHSNMQKLGGSHMPEGSTARPGYLKGQLYIE